MHKRALPRSRKTPDQSSIPHFKGRFRLRLVGSREAGLILLCLASLIGFNLVFAIRNSSCSWLLPGSLPFTVLLGTAVYYFSDLLWRLQVRLSTAVGRINATFMSFFIILLTMVILYFFLLILPMGFLLASFTDGSLVLDYRRWILDLAAVQSLALWACSVARQS
jgi:hypothetical protein